MARQDSESLWIAIGPFCAMALGVVLIPLRTLTSASNLAFAFLVLTIVVAEVGGRGAGLATAVVSALSLNFFLTEPYLTLTINRPDDIVAFVALTISGLIAAAFGRRRARSSEMLGRARDDIDALDRLAGSLTPGTSLDAALEDLRRTFRLAGIVLRRANNQVVAAAPADYAARATPATALDPRTLLSNQRDHRLGRRGFRLPEGGGRLRLAGDPEPLWLDLWEGDEEGLSGDEQRALVVAAAMIRLALRPDPTVGAGLAR
jgi:K+-sensing histidine kinase KdpD